MRLLDLCLCYSKNSEINFTLKYSRVFTIYPFCVTPYTVTLSVSIEIHNLTAELTRKRNLQFKIWFWLATDHHNPNHRSPISSFDYVSSSTMCVR